MSRGADALRVFYGGTFDPVHAGHLAMAEAAAQALGVPVRLMPAADPPHRAVPGADARHRAAMLDLAVQGQPMLRVDRRELLRAGRSYTIHTLHEQRAQYGADAPLAFLIGADSLRTLHTWKDWRALLEGAHLVVAERPGSPLDDLAEPDPVAAHALDAGASEAGPTAVEPPDLTPLDAGSLDAGHVDTGHVDTARGAGMPAADAAVLTAAQADVALRQALAGRWAASPEDLRHGPGGRVLRLRQPLHPASATEIRRRIAAGDADWPQWLAPAVADYIRRHRLYGIQADTLARDADRDGSAPAPAAGG